MQTAGLALLLFIYSLLPACVVSASGLFTCTGGLLSVVAHPDDDLYFQSPMLLPYVSPSSCMTTVFLTSGDSGLTAAYAESREAGNEAAYAVMAGVTDSYTEVNATLGGQTVVVRTLIEAPGVQKVYFRLPDGGMKGKGNAPSYTSLAQLYFGVIDSIPNRYNSADFSLGDLKDALSTIIQARAPEQIATLDYMSVYGCGDHPDHLTTARLTADVASSLNYGQPTGYMGYLINSLAPNVEGGELTSKQNAWSTYAPYDTEVCQSVDQCKNANRPDYLWLFRQYAVTKELASNVTLVPGTSFGDKGSANTTIPSCPNLARIEGVSASATSSAPGQSPDKAIDGSRKGYPVDGCAEWSSYYGGAGTVFNLTWSSPQTFDTVALFDRPNDGDHLTGAILSFQDGSSVTLGALYDGGNASVFTFDQKTSTYISLQVTSVSFTTNNVGLAEFEVYLSTCNATTTNTTDVYTEYENVAPLAVAQASSSSYGQGAQKAIDRTPEGYPTDWTKEWASSWQGKGATLTLTWDQPYTLYALSLYDRPNENDQITAGTVEFDDGTTLDIGPLDNAGAATNVTFDQPITTSTLLFTVTGVSSTTGNVGLAELMAFGEATDNSTALDKSASSYANLTNIAPLATPSASSENDGQTASAAIDTVCDGYPGDYHKEWATNGQQLGATLTLNWTDLYTIYSAVFYDRPNTNDQVLSGVLAFSDGSLIKVGALDNEGQATPVNFTSPITADSVIFTVTGTSSSTWNVGLSELMLFGEVADNSTDQSAAEGLQYPNVAPLAEAEASTEGSVQPASAAIDRVVDGYPGDYTKEWASVWQAAGAMLTLTWTEPYIIHSIALYDRPNLNDHILGGELEFSDGSVVAFGALPNDGSALAVNFTEPIVTETIKFTVTAASDSTYNAGLAEFMAFGTKANSPSSSSYLSSLASATKSGTQQSSIVSVSNSYLRGSSIARHTARPTQSAHSSSGPAFSIGQSASSAESRRSSGSVAANPSQSGTISGVSSASWMAPFSSRASAYASSGASQLSASANLAKSSHSAYGYYSQAQAVPSAVANATSYASSLLKSASSAASGRLVPSNSANSVSSTAEIVSTHSQGVVSLPSHASVVANASSVSLSPSASGKYSSSLGSVVPAHSSGSRGDKSLTPVTSASASQLYSHSAASSAITASSPAASEAFSSAISATRTSHERPSASSRVSLHHSQPLSSGTSAEPTRGSLEPPHSSARPSSSLHRVVNAQSSAASNGARSSTSGTLQTSPFKSSSQSLQREALPTTTSTRAASQASASSKTGTLTTSSERTRSLASSNLLVPTGSRTTTRLHDPESNKGSSTAPLWTPSSKNTSSSPIAKTTTSTTPPQTTISTTSTSSSTSTKVATLTSSTTTSTTSTSSSTSTKVATLTSSTTTSTSTPTAITTTSKPTTVTTTSTTPATKTSSAPATTSGTLAPTAVSTVTASSYRSSSYLPANAYDGKDSTYWLSKGTSGEWIQVNFAQTRNVYAVDLYGISSLLNQINGGTLSFSDGTKVSVGSVTSTGTLVKFTARKTDYIKFTITSTSLLASYVGLTEIEALSISS